MSVVNDLEELKTKVESVLEGVKTAEPTLAELLFKAVEQVFLDAGYTAPAASQDVETTPNA